MCISLVVSSFGTQYWHFLVSQGVLFGIGCAMSYFPALTIISHWFDKKKGLAIGIANAGAGIGGMALAPITRRLITNFGTRFALRIIGGYCGIVTVSAALLLKSRNGKTVIVPFDFEKIAKQRSFVKLFLAALFASFGYFIPFFFLPRYASSKTVRTDAAAFLLGILNGSSAVGRVLLGYSSDYLGHLNTLIMCLLIASLSVLLIWPFSVKFVMLIVFSTLYGLSIGGFIAVFPTAIVGIFGRDHIATITGMVYTGFFWGLLFGPPTAGAILDSTKLIKNGIQTENFIPAMIFCGLALFFSSLILISLKLSTSKGKLLSKI